MDQPKSIHLSERELRDLVKATVHETLVGMGVEADEPLEMQKDFQHVRELRVATTLVKKKALHVLVGVVVAGALGAIWVGLGFKTTL